MGKAEELDEKALNELENAALLHDIGKLALPERLRHQAYDKLELAQRKEFARHAEKLKNVFKRKASSTTVHVRNSAQ